MNFNDIQIQNTAINNLWFNRILLLLDNENYPEHKVIESLKKCLSVIYIPGTLSENKNINTIIDNTEFSVTLKRTEEYYIKLKFFPNKSYIDLTIINGSSCDKLLNIYSIYKIVTYSFKVHELYINSNCVEFIHNDIIDDLTIEIISKIKTDDKLTIFCKYAISVKSIRTLYKLLKKPNITFLIQKEFNEAVVRIFDIHAHRDIKKYKHIKEIPVSHSLYQLVYEK